MSHDAAVTSPSPELVELARSYGIATEYDDWRGRHTEVSGETVADVLTAMGVDVCDPARALAQRQDEPWSQVLPPCIVTLRGEPRWFPVHVPHGDPVEVRLDLEGGGTREPRQVPHWVDPRQVGDRLVGEATFEVPGDLPLGYHTITARSGGTEATCTLVVTPRRLGVPDHLGRRTWGLATQLYSVRSRESWGVGDLTDLTDLAVWSARLGAGYVLVNPLHAAEPVAPMEPSPYLPTSRRFFNPLYVRVERIPEYALLDKAARTRVDALAAEVHERLDGADVIDRNTSWTAKR